MTNSSALALPVARTRHGTVRGVTQSGIQAFKGVPYGGSTAGTGRFRAPAPPEAWSGVREATAYPPMSPQILESPMGLFKSWTYEKETSEACLALNVWTPDVSEMSKRPVMVWLHGGDFASLSGSRNVFDGTRLCLKGDVVVVTLNHRLNLFGFLYLTDLAPEYPDANVGMLDLVLALQWVRDNIAAFGGDPGNVTIFGQSGGGAKVATLMAMPGAAGLFHRAIIQSGSYARTAHLEAMSPGVATDYARRILHTLEIEPAQAATVLPSLGVETLVDAMKSTCRGKHGSMFRPVMDGIVLPSGPWWPQAPSVSAHVPLIIGTTASEMTTLLGSRDPVLFDLDEAGLNQRLNWVPQERLAEVISSFRANRPSATPAELYFAISTSIIFRRGALRHAELAAARQGAPVYLYELDWPTPVDGGRWGTPHSMDLPLVFDNVALSGSVFGAGERDAQRIADQMSAAWLAFARTGNPQTAQLPIWSPYTSATPTTLVFDLDPRAVEGFRDSELRSLEGLHMLGPLD